MEAICAREMNVRGIALFLLEEVILTWKDILLKIVARHVTVGIGWVPWRG